MDSTLARISTSPRLLSSQPFKVLTPAAARSRLADNKCLADQHLHTGEGGEVIGQEQNVTHTPKKVRYYFIHRFMTSESVFFAMNKHSHGITKL